MAPSWDLGLVNEKGQRPSCHPRTPATRMPVSSFPFTQDGVGKATKEVIGPPPLTSPLKHSPRDQARPGKYTLTLPHLSQVESSSSSILFPQTPS